jgi:DNA-binding NarL/FixJ family response regulator
MIRVLIADDHEVMRFGLQMMLSGEPDMTIIGTAAEGSTALAMAIADLPDVVLMDLSMPVLDGVAATREIVNAVPSAHVLVLTAHSQAAIVRSAFAAGASGYLLKDSSTATVLDAIRAVHRNESPMAPIVRDILFA